MAENEWKKSPITQKGKKTQPLLCYSCDKYSRTNRDTYRWVRETV